jgi:hypothetical protein
VANLKTWRQSSGQAVRKAGRDSLGTGVGRAERRRSDGQIFAVDTTNAIVKESKSACGPLLSGNLE